MIGIRTSGLLALIIASVANPSNVQAARTIDTPDLIAALEDTTTHIQALTLHQRLPPHQSVKGQLGSSWKRSLLQHKPKHHHSSHPHSVPKDDQAEGPPCDPSKRPTTTPTPSGHWKCDSSSASWKWADTTITDSYSAYISTPADGVSPEDQDTQRLQSDQGVGMSDYSFSPSEDPEAAEGPWEGISDTVILALSIVGCVFAALIAYCCLARSVWACVERWQDARRPAADAELVGMDSAALSTPPSAKKPHPARAHVMANGQPWRPSQTFKEEPSPVQVVPYPRNLAGGSEEYE